MSSVFDRRAEGAVTAALGNKIVRREIFGSLPLGDLKHCRLVNRSWNFDAVSFIKDFRRCQPRISKERPCTDLVELAQVVRGMNIVPINSLSIELDRSSHSECKLIENQDKFFCSLLEELPLKYLRVSWENGFRTLNCPVASFVIDLLRRKAMELSTLEFYHLPKEFLTYFGQLWAPWLPKLKVLDIGYWYRGNREDQKKFFLKIVNGAPNLRKLEGTDFDTEFLGVIPEDKYSVLDDVGLSIDSETEELRCFKLAQSGPTLSCLELHPPSTRQFMRSYIHVAQKLFSSSYKSLKTFTMIDPLLPLDLLSFRPLINVDRISITTEETTPHLLHVIRSIDYPKLLPALYKIEVNVHMDFVPDDDPVTSPWENSDAAQVVQVHPSTTVKHLEISADFHLLTFKMLSQLFPNVVHFDAHLLQPLVDPAGSTSHIDLWAGWPYLEVIALGESSGALRRNFDAEFLGISPEEVEILRRFDDEALEKINIVPIRPCLLTLLRLRRLKLEFYSSGVQAEVDADQVFLSKLTGILAFKKMARQGVKIQFVMKNVHATLCLSHLSPFVSV